MGYRAYYQMGTCEVKNVLSGWKCEDKKLPVCQGSIIESEDIKTERIKSATSKMTIRSHKYLDIGVEVPQVYPPRTIAAREQRGVNRRPSDVINTFNAILK